MKLAERYVYAVTQHLPENIREEVSRELHAHIHDMLPVAPTETDIRAVLEKLGNPAILANEYSPVKKYLIGPTLYDKYFTVLKLVMGIVALVFASITLFAEIFTPSLEGGISGMSFSIIADMFNSVIEGLLQAFLWVTLVFFILERNGVNDGKRSFRKQQWSPDDLPALPVPAQKRISRGETVFSMVVLIFFTALLTLQPELIGVYWKSESGFSHVSLLVIEQLRTYIFVILLLAAFHFGILVWKMIVGHWNLLLAWVNAIGNLASSVLVAVMLSDKDLFNPVVFMKTANVLNIPLSKIMAGWSWSVSISIVVFILISVGDGIKGFMKSKKTQKTVDFI